jgi:hypothetical protein
MIECNHLTSKWFLIRPPTIQVQSQKNRGDEPPWRFVNCKSMDYSSSPSVSEDHPTPVPKPPEKLGVEGGVNGAGSGAGVSFEGAAAAGLGAALFFGVDFFLGAAFLATFAGFFRGAALRFIPDLREEAFLRAGLLAIFFLRGFAAFFFALFFAKPPPPFIPKPEPGKASTGRPGGL